MRYDAIKRKDGDGRMRSVGAYCAWVRIARVRAYVLKTQRAVAKCRIDCCTSLERWAGADERKEEKQECKDERIENRDDGEKAWRKASAGPTNDGFAASLSLSLSCDSAKAAPVSRLFVDLAGLDRVQLILQLSFPIPTLPNCSRRSLRRKIGDRARFRYEKAMRARHLFVC